MRTSQFVWLVTLAGITVVLAFTIVVLSAINDKVQQDLQAQQMAVNNGVLGPQGQQVSAAILQDMAKASTESRDLRMLLKRYGYTIQSGAATNAPTAGGAADKATKGKDEVKDEQ